MKKIYRHSTSLDSAARVAGQSVVLASILAFTSCGPIGLGTPSITNWSAGPSESIKLSDPARDQTSVFNRNENVIRLSAAVNETTAFEYVLAAEHTARGIAIGLEDLTGPAGTIPRSQVQIYRHLPITIDRFPNWYLRSVGLREPRPFPDVLVPIEASGQGPPFSVKSDENLVFWIDVAVPPATPVGVYKGAVLVQTTSGKTLLRTPIELTVRDLYFVPQDNLAMLADVQIAPIIKSETGLDPDNMRLVLGDEKTRNVLTRTFELLQDHGLSPFTDDVRPKFQQDIDGAIQYDWSEYDQFCGRLIEGDSANGRQAVAAWPLPVDLEQPKPAYYQGLDSSNYLTLLKSYMEGVADHFEEKNWIDRAFVYFDLPGRSNPRPEDIERIRRFAELTRDVDSRLKFVTRLIPQSMSPYGWFDHHYEDLTGLIGAWCTPARYTRPTTLSSLQGGAQTWLYPDRPPYSGSLAVEAPPVQTRSLAWQAWLEGDNAIFLEYVSQWPEAGFKKDISDAKQHTDAWLIYPGKEFGVDHPIPSVRLKQLRLGLQDYQRLKVLERNGRRETARLLAGSLIKATGTDTYGDNYQDGLFSRRVDDPSLYELARKILDSELADVLRDPGLPAPDHSENQNNWAIFLDRTRRIDVQQESAKLRMDRRRPEQPFVLTFDTSIRSELRTSLSGELTFGPLPLAATRVSDRVMIGPLYEMALIREKLALATPTLPPTDLDGHFIQKIVFNGGAQGYAEMDATAAIIRAVRAISPPEIDGSLKDWPPAEANAAGDFRLINAYSGRPRPKAESQTIAYFSHDTEMLYIGLHAGQPKKRDKAPQPLLRNFVEYEDLMPIGEDLIEIVIDPTNVATQSEDLYHIIVKSTGIAIFERGIGTAPPIGKTEPWPGSTPRVRVTKTDYGWSAELAIPLEVFQQGVSNMAIWGINLARLEPIRGEYSDWAQANRHCYDPRTLGNLVWDE